MICRNCGTEIADKAIVCYRCGTGTADPVRKPAAIRPRRSPLVPAVVIVVVLAVLAWYLGRTYHVFGLEVALPTASARPAPSPYPGSSLIHLPPAHA
jgi:hypothetical protein